MPNVRTFGEATTGLTSANEEYPMGDGAILNLTAAVESDRTGHVYEGAIPPDEVVTLDWVHFGRASDPGIVAASKWIACG